MGLATPKRLKTHVGLAAAHRYAPKHEAKTAKRLGGKITAGSGNKHEKGDVRVNGILRAELKCTSRKSFSVTRDMLDKIAIAAKSRGEIPAMEILFMNPDGSTGESYAVVPSDVLDMLVKIKGETKE